MGKHARAMLNHHGHVAIYGIDQIREVDESYPSDMDGTDPLLPELLGGESLQILEPWGRTRGTVNGRNRRTPLVHRR